MGNDGMALLVVLGLGGLVLWYLTKTPATRPVTTQGQPCVLGGSYGGVGVQASCGAIEKGLEKAGGLFNTLTPFLPASLHFGSSELCRADPSRPYGGKAVYPNDLEECRKRYGITDCHACGKLFNETTRQWPWTAELNRKANLPAGTEAGATSGYMGWRAPPNPNAGETQVSAKPLYPIGKPAGFR